jgi:O-antigen ligase
MIFENRYITLAKILLSLGIIILFLKGIERKQIFLKGSFALPFLLFSFSLFPMLAYSVNIPNSLERLIIFIGFYLQYIFIFNFSKSYRIVKNVGHALIIIGIISSIGGIYDYLKFQEGERATSFFYDPNYFANLLISVIPLVIAYILIFKKRIMKLFLTFIFLLFNIVLFLTFSRSAWLSTAIIYLLMFFMFMKKERVIRYLPILLLACFVFIPKNLLQLGIKRVSIDYSTLTRIELLKSSLKIIKDHPITGVGLANFKNVYPMYESPTAFYQGKIYAHNSYLEFWAEAGTVSFLLFLFLLFIVFKNYIFAIRVFKKDYEKYYICFFFFLATIANFIQAFFFSFEHLKLFWFWVAFSFVWRRLSEAKSFNDN